MGFLVNCGGASIDCSDSTVKETVVKIIKERFEEEEVDTSDVKIKLSDIETISKDENSCECVAIIHITVEDESLPFPITYDANKTGKSGQILVSVSAFDL
jgi:hypothetical protein